MTKQDSFQKAQEKVTKSANFKAAAEKMEALNMAELFKARGIDVTKIEK